MILLEVTVIASGATVGKKLGSPQPFKAAQASSEQGQSENKPVTQKEVQSSKVTLSNSVNKGKKCALDFNMQLNGVL